MQRFNANEVGIDQGELTLVTDFDTQGPMWTEQGERTVRQRVDFSERFLMPPAVHLSLGMWDLDVTTNQRGDLLVENVTSAGFDLLFHTWGDTRVARMRIQWMAIGALPDEQDFVL
ncbi:MAG: H-type lectin domain-containing protein [Paracoccus sp. (in: a-proteobacteria)]|nr:H-type lectin domain-containing protein [Paracoccus sp. (in: a-proteobacteria)]